MQKNMKQMIMTGPRRTEIIEAPIPEITDDRMLVKVTLTGMCHSEFYPWTLGKNGTGNAIGHETVGVVVKVGANVKGNRALANH